MKTYMKFIELSTRIETGFDLNCTDLLNQIALSESNGTPLTVMNAMGLDWIASPATLHRRLTELQKTGYIFLKHEGENKRTKYVVTTLKAREYFNEVEKCLLLSVH